MQKNIVVVAEILNNTLRSVTFEIVAFAEELAKVHSADIKIIVISSTPKNYAEKISTTGHDVLAVTSPMLKKYNGDAYKNILQSVIDELNPFAICIGHTSQGVDLAPGLAIKLDCSCITCINGISKKEGKAVFSRSIFGGKMNAFIQPETDSAVLTIQPGIFNKEYKPGNSGEIIHLTMPNLPSKIKSTGITKPESITSLLNDAKTIIAIGRGIEESENISLVEKFSGLFANAAIACSRPVVDMGWMKYRHQVGITGAEVAPDIYIACGISGSSQHIAGMSRSKFIIAINNDPNAAIFNASDICIEEDILSFFKSFEETIVEI